MKLEEEEEEEGCPLSPRIMTFNNMRRRDAMDEEVCFYSKMKIFFEGKIGKEKLYLEMLKFRMICARESLKDRWKKKSELQTKQRMPAMTHSLSYFPNYPYLHLRY